VSTIIWHIAGSLRHRAGVAVQRIFTEDLDERPAPSPRCGRHRGLSEPGRERRRPPERPFHRDLLVEEHADEEGQRVVHQELIRRRVTRDREGCDCHGESIRGPPPV
jgi:hypothetical protein